MTLDWLATEDGKRAVEAGGKAAHAKSSPGVPWETLSPETRKAWCEEIAPALLTPELDRMFRERYAKELEDKAKNGRPGLLAEGLLWGATHLRREPTL